MVSLESGIISKVLSFIYKENPPLYQIEDSWTGFEWISADENKNNVFSFIRKDKYGNKIIVVLNFSGNDYMNYRLGVDKGKYKILISTDQIKYGGTGLIKNKVYTATKNSAHKRDYSIKLNLPKFSGAYLIEYNGKERIL